MNHHRKWRPLFGAALFSLAALPATAAANASPQTGEVTLHFTQRSPLSSRKEIARRLSWKESTMGGDYDLASVPFRAYIPRNYDSSIPCGVFVYLGNHDVNTVATRWEPFFDKSHMIYIAPDWHSHMPEWELVGLGLDAVDNLKHLYNIDTHRLYDMWFNSGSVEMPLAGADVYTGMIVGEDWEYFRRIDMPGNRFHAADFPRPAADLLDDAKPHGVVLISLTPPDPGAGFITNALKEDGFDHVLSISETYEALHYPNYAASWISDPVLPFLDKFARPSAATPATSLSRTSLSASSDAMPGRVPPATLPSRTSLSAIAAGQQNPAVPATLPSRPSSAPPSNADAQHLLSMARLFIDNGDTERARANLQAILAKYPGDPAAIPAKKLLDSLPPPAQQ